MTNDRFRDAIRIHFGDRNDIDTKETLSILMRNHEFRIVKDRESGDIISCNPSQTQLDYAWNYLKYGIVENKGVEFRPDSPFSVEYIRDNVFRLRDKKTGRFVKKE